MAASWMSSSRNRSLWHRDLPARRRISSSACSDTLGGNRKLRALSARPSSSDSLSCSARQHSTSRRTSFAGSMLDAARRWTDDDLYAHFALTDDGSTTSESASNRARSTCRSAHPHPVSPPGRLQVSGQPALTSRATRTWTNQKTTSDSHQAVDSPAGGAGDRLEGVAWRIYATRCPARTPSRGVPSAERRPPEPVSQSRWATQS